jgi:iron(III) transport system ATP-binding protein
MTALLLQAVSKRFGNVPVLDRIDLAVAAGSRTAIVGPSGSGKTTLLRIIAGFEAPDQGRVAVGGEVVAGDAAFVPAFRRGIGIVAQEGALFPHLTLAENIGFGLPRAAADRAARIAALMEMVGLDRSMLGRKPDEISGGQQQRVALARALAVKPRLMLLDEPFSALDAGLRAQTRKAVAELLAAQRITTVLVTHDQEEALSFADQVAVMREGRFSQVGAPREVYLHPADAMVATFLGEAIILPAEIAGGIAQCVLGRVGVGAAGPGAREIMLRPEQISLARLGRDDEPAAIRGEITEIDFAGAFATVALRLPGRPDGEPLRFRTTLAEPLHTGDTVGIRVSGTAHVFG